MSYRHRLAEDPGRYLDLNYCEFIFNSQYQMEYVLFALALLCLAIMIFFYSRSVLL